MVPTSQIERNVTLLVLFLLCLWRRLVPSLKTGNVHGNDNEMKGIRERESEGRMRLNECFCISKEEEEETKSRLNVSMHQTKMSPLFNYG